ncbi:hypothetical protein D3C72_2152630 [compost metagenome]
MTNEYKRDTERAAIVAQVARITGYKKDYVRRVINGKRHNEQVIALYMEILESKNVTENNLIKAVQQLLPF